MADAAQASDCNVIIQNYLQNFDADIKQHQEQDVGNAEAEELLECDEEEGTYFVDQQGRYYYQAKPGSQPVLVTSVDGTEEEKPCEDEITLQEESRQVSIEQRALQTATLISSCGEGVEDYVLIGQPEGELKIQGEEGSSDRKLVYEFEVLEAEPENSDGEDDKGKITKYPAKVRKHNQRFKCDHCSYTSPRRYLLSRHSKVHCDDRPYQCSVCERNFKTLASLTNHVNTHTGVKPNPCKFCSSTFTTSGELIRHVRYRHTHEKPHKCHECDYASVELSKLRRHLRTHTGERPYQCLHCTYASADTFKLKRHLRTHTGEKPYACDVCEMNFSQSNSLKAHKLIHDVESKPMFQCELCPASCGRKTDLRIHIQKLHIPIVPLNCKCCHKTFYDKYTYKLHCKTHQGEKCFKCEICPYASATRRHLSSHMLNHTDERPFACSECDQAFRQKQLLRRHFNVYHNTTFLPAPPMDKTHKCADCDRLFAHKGNLIRHMSVHDPDSNFHEKQLQLRLGRTKRIFPQSTEDKESKYSEEDEDEVKESMEVCTAGSDQQYVVFQVIQLPSCADEDDQQVVIVAPDNQNHAEAKSEIRKRGVNINIEKNMEACFGFDEVDDEI